MALQIGTYKNLANNRNSVYAYLRQKDGENIIVISNLSANAIDTIQVSLLGTGIPYQAYTGTNLLDGKTNHYLVNQLGSIHIEPLTAYQTKWIKLSSATGINSIDLSNTFKVYPIPSSDLVEIESNAIAANCQITLFDLNGKKISTDLLNIQIEAQKMSLNLAQLPDGIYNLTIDNLNLTKNIRLVKVSQ